MKYSEEKKTFIDDKYDFSIDKQPKKGFIGALIGLIPGSILWLLLTFYTPFGGTMGIPITIGTIWGFKARGNYITTKIKNLLLLLTFFVMIILTSVITSYTLYYEYTKDVISEANLKDVTDSFITDLKNNGQSVDANEQFLKNTYNINGFGDKKGFNNLAKKTLGEVYMEEHKVSCVPDNAIGAIRCLYPFVAYDREIGKPFIYNILSGLIFSILTSSIMLKFDRFKPYEF